MIIVDRPVGRDGPPLPWAWFSWLVATWRIMLSTHSMNARPNVLLVLADQWRAQSCGWMGNSEVQTPHLDRFARESVNCRLAASGCPVCTPARASLLTGLRPDRHGLFLNDAPLNPELPSMGKQFATAGYDTAWIGKWHVDGHGRYAYIPPERRHGFAYFKALECTHDYNHSRYYDNNDPTLRFWTGYDAIAQTDDCIRWLQSRRGDRPFLAVLSWGPPHSPFLTAPQSYRDRYDPAALTIPANVPPAEVSEVRKNLAGYYAHITALDDCFGRLMAVVPDNTIVLFTSDHGDLLGAHGLWDKQGPWDESLRIPFLLRAPGWPAGAVNDSLIDWLDVWPTLCGLAGLPQPSGIQGRDFSRHLLEGTVPTDNGLLYASYHNFGNWGPIARRHSLPLFYAREARGLRTERFTYVEDLTGPWLLYDNEADPLQLRNLAGQHPQQKGLADRLHAKLRAEDDEFLSGMDYVRRWGYTVDESGTIPITNWEG